MEPLWSPVGATGRNWRQIDGAGNPRKQAKSVATGCDRLPETFHGKEGVSGSSPEEGSKRPANQLFLLFCAESRVRWGQHRRREPGRLQGFRHRSVLRFRVSDVRKVALRSHGLQT